MSIEALVSRFEDLKRVTGMVQSLRNLPECEFRDALLHDCESFLLSKPLIMMQLETEIFRLRTECSMHKQLCYELREELSTLTVPNSFLGRLKWLIEATR